MKEQNIFKEDWDILIILDACRYDFFENKYQNYLDGELEKRRSKGSSTIEWLKKNFRGYHGDVVYISSNPYVNSKGVSFHGWDPDEHLPKIIDVWYFGWDKNKGTVYPGKVNEAALNALSENDGKRVIVHYLQPHTPYLTDDCSFKFWEQGEKLEGEMKIDPNASLPQLPQAFLKLVETNVGERAKWKLEELTGAILGIIGMEGIWRLKKRWNAVCGSERFWRRFHNNTEKLYSLYEDNLELVLESVSDLIHELDRKVVVTADHGEAFGERGIWEHYPNTRIPALVEVPWLEIEK